MFGTSNHMVWHSFEFPAADMKRSTDLFSPSSMHIHSHTHTEFPLTLRPNTPLPRLTFRHRACCWVIALLINVFPSQDNGLVFTLCFSRLAMKDIQWCNLLSVHYLSHGSLLGGGEGGHCFELVVGSLIYQCSIFCFQLNFYI